MIPDRLSILLVGSNPSDSATLRTIIAEASAGTYQIEHSASRDAAILRLEEASFDAIVISLSAGDAQISLPIAALRSHAASTPIVALMSDDEDTPGLCALRAGAQAYLSRRRLAGHTVLHAIHSAIERARIGSLQTDVYRTLVDRLPLGVSQIARSGQLRIANPATEYMLGIRDGAASSARSFLDLFPGKNRDYIAELIERAFAGERMEIEYSLAVRGQRRVFTSSLIPITGEDGTIDSLLAMTQDVTDQIELRLEAEIERDRLSAAIQSSNDAMIMFDLERRL
ncbi:MAG TPA: PAS domain-containing protein, partial [Roseiflexaceae bacterium]|nr:PAS domain-containing protein [Roseiflexaceae bacterium]